MNITDWVKEKKEQCKIVPNNDGEHVDLCFSLAYEYPTALKIIERYREALEKLTSKQYAEYFNCSCSWEAKRALNLNIEDL